VYQQFQKAGPEIFIPAPPLHEDFHRGPEFDRAKLQEKINNELGNDILEKPIEVNKKSDYEAGINEPPNPVIDQVIPSDTKPVKLDIGANMGADSDSSVREKRNKVKEVSAKIYSSISLKLV
jgi:hypothetical protein